MFYSLSYKLLIIQIFDLWSLKGLIFDLLFSLRPTASKSTLIDMETKAKLVSMMSPTDPDIKPFRFKLNYFGRQVSAV